MKENPENVAPKIKALSNLQILSITITAFVVVGLWLANYFLLEGKLGIDKINDRGTFGDMFGAVNALFSGLAFAGIIFTILLQRNELKLQREESQKSRTEAIEQNKTLRQQRFENTFFNMLNLQNEIVKNLKLADLEGRQVIDKAKTSLYTYINWENFLKVYKDVPSKSESLHEVPISVSNARAVLDTFYHKDFYDRYSSSFNHYFRHLYHIFKFIYFSGLDLEEKKFYASLVRAQLSQGELYLISFNMLIEGYGRPKFLYLVEEYDILQNFDWADIYPPVYKELMEEELITVEYPFENMEKPVHNNIDIKRKLIK